MILIQKATYAPGQMVIHQKYKYLALVFDVDPIFQPDGITVTSNREADKPWYYILINGGTETAYVSEENLDPIDFTDDFTHPLLSALFVDHGPKGIAVRYSVN